MLTLWLVLSICSTASGNADALDAPLEKPLVPRSGPAVPLGLERSLPTGKALAGALPFFEADAFHRSRHYVVLDQRGAESAREMTTLLEEGFAAFERVLRAAPEVDEDRPLRVEVYRAPTDWRERLTTLRLATGPPEDPSRYDARSRTALVLAGETDYETRAFLLGAAMRQFHHHAKAKNQALVDHWFVLGLAEMAAMHRWDGERLEIGAHLSISKIDTPALALEAMRQRPANLRQFTPEVLESRPMAWTLTGFLMEGEGGKHKKRFEKLALGHRGSMIDGTRFARSLGRPNEVVPAVESWLRSRQQPLEVLAGDFEDIGDGNIVGRGGKSSALAAPRNDGQATRLRCLLDLGLADAAGLLVGYKSGGSFTYLLFQRRHLYVGRVRPGSHQLELFRPQPRSTSGLLRLEAFGTDGVVQLRVDGEELGRVVVPDQRLGLVTTRGSATFSRIEWE